MPLSKFTLCRPALQAVHLCHFLVFFVAYEVDYTFFVLPADHDIQAAQDTGNLVAKYTLGNWQTRYLLCAGLVFEDLF